VKRPARGRVGLGVVWGALLCLLAALPLRARPAPAAPAPAPPLLRAARLASGERLALDGRGDESAWGRAEEGGGFVERTPTPGAAPPVRTAVRALFDDEALYVLVRMETRPGEPPVAWELRRDRTEMWSDDAISLKIDPRLDARTSVVFVTNPAGAQLDFISLDNGQVFSVEHDAVWEVGTSVDEGAGEGAGGRRAGAWTAEYRIPFAALGLSAEAARAGAVGFNLSRDHNGRQATDDWALLAPEFGPFSALHYGRLEGLEGVAVGRPLTIMPYGLARAGAGGARAAQAGGELRLALSDAEWLEATALTDFAQVDLDDPLINLDRFALFFPERRPFFIQGLDVFSFGRPGRAQLFFSRRVGLTEGGDELPVYGGLKAYGRRGGLRYGALSALTAAEGDDPMRLWAVARGRQDLGAGGYVGVMLTAREGLEGERRGGAGGEPGSYGAGVDARARLLDARLDLSGFYGLTLNPLAAGAVAAGGAAGVEASWRDRRVRPSLRLDWVSGDFDPKLGFTYRRDYAQPSAALAGYLYSPAPWLRLLTLTLSAQQTRSADLARDLGAGGDLALTACHLSNWCLSGGAGLLRDVVDSRFALGAAAVGAGVYDSGALSLGVTAPAGRRLGGEAWLTSRPGRFGGDLSDLSLTARAALSPHLRLALSGSAARYDLGPRAPTPEGDVGGAGASLGASGQVIITPTPAAQLDAVGQLNSDTGLARLQARLRWRYLPGSDLFLVVRRDLPTPLLGAPAAGGGEGWSVTLKVGWRLDEAL